MSETAILQEPLMLSKTKLRETEAICTLGLEEETETICMLEDTLPPNVQCTPAPTDGYEEWH
jgi:hypothetical protein